MPAKSPSVDDAATYQLGLIGRRIREHRKALKINAIHAAEAAGMSRVTLHRIERGEASVTMGAYLNAATAIGLEIGVRSPSVTPGTPALPRGRPAGCIDPASWKGAPARLTRD